MAQNRRLVIIAEPSLIIRRGVVSLLLNIDLGVDVEEVEEFSQLREVIAANNPDLVVVNPTLLGLLTPKDFLVGDSVRMVALQTQLSFVDLSKDYHGVISIFDNELQVQALFDRLFSNVTEEEQELSQREKEIVIAIAHGKSNKEIANELFISTHTVMTHRKNIAAKLKIHNSAGITIYAIVNKLIDV